MPRDEKQGSTRRMPAVREFAGKIPQAGYFIGARSKSRDSGRIYIRASRLKFAILPRNGTPPRRSPAVCFVYSLRAGTSGFRFVSINEGNLVSASFFPVCIRVRRNSVGARRFLCSSFFPSPSLSFSSV